MPERECYQKIQSMSFSLGHEERAMEKQANATSLLEIKQINKYRDGGTQVSWQEGEPFSLIIRID
jgi:hypothetical protein